MGNTEDEVQPLQRYLRDDSRAPPEAVAGFLEGGGVGGSGGYYGGGGGGSGGRDGNGGGDGYGYDVYGNVCDNFNGVDISTGSILLEEGGGAGTDVYDKVYYPSQDSNSYGLYLVSIVKSLFEACLFLQLR